MTEVDGKVAKDSHWLTWCRLCAKDDPRENVKVECKTTNKQNQSESTWENILVMAIKKYFEVNMCLEDELSSMLCTECYTLISELIDFSEHVTKVQAIFQVLRRNDSRKNLDVAALRKQYGLRPGDWTHIIKPSENEADCDDKLTKYCGSSREFVDIGITAECDKLLENEAEEFVNLIVLEEVVIDGRDNEMPIKRPRGRSKSTDITNPIETTQSTSSSNNNGTGSDHSWTNTDVDNVEDNFNNSTVDVNIEFLPEPYAASPAQSPSKPDNDAAETVVDGYSDSLMAEDDVSSNFSDMTCNKCGKSYQNAACFQKHMDYNCSNPNEFQQLFIDKSTTCNICQKRLSSVAALKLHKEGMHENSKPFVCDCCGKLLKTITALNEHKLVHTEDRPFVCPICKAGFKNNARLKIHNQIHEEPKYVCNICGKKLQTRRTWNMHKLVHSEERKLKCDICSALFKRSKTLKTHLLSHTGLKPYVCNYCERTFACNANCRAHKLKKHPQEVAQEGESTPSRLSVPTLDELRIMTQEIAKVVKES